MESQLTTTSPDRTPAGRQTVYSAAIHGKLVTAYRMGATQEMACNYAGISVATFHNWRQQVIQQDMNTQFLEEKTALFDDIARAKAELQTYHLTLIEQQAAKDWRAAAWKLERIFPRDFGTRTSIDMEVASTGPMEIVRESYDLSKLSDEQLDAVMALLEGVKSEVVEVIEGQFKEVDRDGNSNE